MSDESNDNEGQKNSLEQLGELLNELKDEIRSSQRTKLFEAAELLYSLGVKCEVCRIPGTKEFQHKNDYALVIPNNQIKNLKLALIKNL